jgi:hypothetical protein
LVHRKEFFWLKPALILHPALFNFAFDSRAQDLAVRHTSFWFRLSTHASSTRRISEMIQKFSWKKRNRMDIQRTGSENDSKESGNVTRQ